MALPIALAIAFPGAVLGRAVARAACMGDGGGCAGRARIPGRRARPVPPVHEVVTVVEIAAPPEVVWRHVVSFPELAPPTELLFAPGSRHRCAPGSMARHRRDPLLRPSRPAAFVEPITPWQENHAAFVRHHGPGAPMTELSPYGEIHPPHLDGYFERRTASSGSRLCPGTDPARRADGLRG